MFRILVVDDEHIERRGIRFLIRKYGLELEVLEADNGEEALDVLEAEPVDILLTDIKMPFMDGLELCRRARERFPGLKIIIFSAYGEFEYARQAIEHHIFSYLLKPIDVGDFTREFARVLETCRQEQEEKEREKRLLEGYAKGMEHERENLLLGLLYGTLHLSADQLAQAGFGWDARNVRLVLVDTEDPVFGAADDRFAAAVRAVCPSGLEIVNLNEHQSLLFLSSEPNEEREPSELGRRLQEELAAALNAGNVTIVIGRPVSDPWGIAEEFRCMESTAEEKFFHPNGAVLYTDESQAKRDLSAVLPKLVETVNWHLEAQDGFGYRRGVELFFKTVEGSGQHSQIFVKYLCAEMAKKLLQARGKHEAEELRQCVEEIFGSPTLASLERSFTGWISRTGDTEESSPDHTKKAIKDIVKLIEEHYAEPISLGWLADRVYLTQTYLSYLFTKEMGQPFVKYLTQVRIRKAAELLRSTHLSIADISAQVGYPNDSYFCKIFKHHHGISPAKYREGRG
ncbi:response regulator [Cohnella caldifontis]|uniref:response regulator n=1 Tax=Cohnella caldifontis TaxID=3027471 RepID=UPI0023EAECAF|nr:response regulator [Cohnella sp. YIM B05605]